MKFGMSISRAAVVMVMVYFFHWVIYMNICTPILWPPDAKN